MKKVLISFLVGSILIGIGLGVTVMEISNWDFVYDNPMVSNQPVKTTDEDFYMDLENQYVNATLYVHTYGTRNVKDKIEVIKDSSLEDTIEVEVQYRGKEPRLYFYESGSHYNDAGTLLEQSYTLTVSDGSFSFKDIKELIGYAFENKVAFSTSAFHEIEKITVKTGNPEQLKIKAY